MNTRALPVVLFLAASACQPVDYVEPVDDPTGNPPPPANQVYGIDGASSTPYLTANLTATNAVSAVFMVQDGAIIPAPVNGVYPASAGSAANLRGGVGFGTYANPDLRVAGATWTPGAFPATLSADVTLASAGDAATFCRSFATTCASVLLDPLGNGQSFVLLTMAANVPDTEIGQIAANVSAAIRGTGSAGLTIAITDAGATLIPVTLTAGTPFELAWHTSRGAVEGSLDYRVSIDGAVVAEGNNAADLAGVIKTTGGAALIFDRPFADDASVGVDYAYSYEGVRGRFTDILIPGVDLSPQLGLGTAPLALYPSTDPRGAVGTLSGEAGLAHAVQWEDGVLGAVASNPGSGSRTVVYSTAFDGDDFAGTPYATFVDQGVTGGGFYPSPSFCFSQILPGVDVKVEAAVRASVHQRMYGAMANGVYAADLSLPGLAAALPSFGVPAAEATYTKVGSAADYIAIGTDYADGNVDTLIDTSAKSTFTVTWTNAKAITFRDQLGTMLAAVEKDSNKVLNTMVSVLGSSVLTQYRQLKTLHIAMTTPPGSMDGTVDSNGVAKIDVVAVPYSAATCAGYDCNVAWITHDLVNGTNTSGRNSSAGVPALAATALWGIAPSAGSAEMAATLTGNPATDHPAYPAVPASAAVAPVREQAASSVNTLVQGIYGNFHEAAFGTTVPASNFSLELDTAGATPPSVSRITITAE